MQVSVIHYSGSYNSKYSWHFLIKPVIPAYLLFPFHRQFIEPLDNLTPYYIVKAMLHEAIRSDDFKRNTLESFAKMLPRHCFEL